MNSKSVSVEEVEEFYKNKEEENKKKIGWRWRPGVFEPEEGFGKPIELYGLLEDRNQSLHHMMKDVGMKETKK